MPEANSPYRDKQRAVVLLAIKRHPKLSSLDRTIGYEVADLVLDALAELRKSVTTARSRP